MKYILIIFLFSFRFLNAQISDSINIRKEIYEIILKDLEKNNPKYPIKLIYLDDKINKFNAIDLFNLNVMLTNPDYVRDESVCKSLVNVKCSDKFELDNYNLYKIFNEHKDIDYPDFYGIYAPIDSWYQLVYQLVYNNFEKSSKIKSEVVIPVKNIYFKNEEVISEMIFYKFWIDEKFKIIKNQLIKF